MGGYIHAIIMTGLVYNILLLLLITPMSKFVLVYGVPGGHFVHVSTLHREYTSSLIKGTRIKSL